MSKETTAGPGIYKIENKKNGHLYIGSSSDVHDRFRRHKNSLTTNKHHSDYLQNAWNKYGKDNFVFIVIKRCPKKELIEREQYYFDKLKPKYNMSPTAGRMTHTKESKKKLSIAHTGKKLSKEHKKKLSLAHIGKGHPMAEKTKRKLRLANMGHKVSEETRRKIGKANSGRKHTEEAKKKISKGLSGKNNPRFGKHPSKATRIKMSLAKKGKKLSKEHRKKLSLAHIGKIFSREHRKNLSGPTNPCSKLNKNQVKKIRYLRNKKKLPIKVIAKKFNVSLSIVRAVATFKTYKYT